MDIVRQCAMPVRTLPKYCYLYCTECSAGKQRIPVLINSSLLYSPKGGFLSILASLGLPLTILPELPSSGVLALGTVGRELDLNKVIPKIVKIIHCWSSNV